METMRKGGGRDWETDKFCALCSVGVRSDSKTRIGDKFCGVLRIWGQGHRVYPWREVIEAHSQKMVRVMPKLGQKG
ncbi:hypothetical protein N7468_006446 [Penicillium chermesinum]|uniref:Uncharacterized protein n=1 Tax=Penicillium chermesinum TaxID=63820 RepID=A0A9W9NT00_9EURO|nr:uncharacterized protein N7468_006446 [Penicillium chermesinum]KAJ5225221.1 hypothetical protein N7468_006446 [Penicillium chermesinum]KAJ6140532.1 hypothetical protein N7470_010328 [Penicillium chermesinum]